MHCVPMDTIKGIKLIILICIYLSPLGCHVESSSCEFPTSMLGTWFSSRRGELTFNETHISSINTTLTGFLLYDCFKNIGDTYIIRSETFMLHNSLHRAYFCLEIWSVTSASLAYQHKTSKNAQANNERYKLYPAISSVTTMDICDVSAATASWEMLVKQGSMTDAAVSCPNVIRGVYNYTITENSVTSCGLTTSSFDTCTDTMQPTVNMSLCTDNVAYSNDGVLQCVYSNEDIYTYVIVMNMDNTTDETSTYRFTCLVGEVSGDYTYISQFPEMCQTTQTPTSAPTGGAILVMLPSELCPSRARQEVPHTILLAFVFLFGKLFLK